MPAHAESASFSGRIFRRGLLVLCCLIMAACVAGSGAGSGPSIPAGTAFRIVGTNNTPFTAVITDKVASWKMVGVVPQSVVILNPQPPVRMIASKLANDSSLLSVEIIYGGTIIGLSSTNTPFGTLVVQTGQGLTGIAPSADPDVRFFVKGAFDQLYNGLIEDLEKGFEIEDVAPTLYLFENPHGRVDGFFNLAGFIPVGPLDADLIIGGNVVASARGEPSIQVK